MKDSARRMLGALALTLVTATVVVGSAAAEHPNDRAGALGVGGVSLSPVEDRAVIPNDRAGRLGVGAIELQAPTRVPAQPDDRGGLRRSGSASTEAQAGATASGERFQWADAAFGAAAALGIILLGVAGAIALRHRSRVILP